MYLPKPSDNGDFTPPPAGTHLAICYRFIDLGTQAGEYQGKPTSLRKVMLSWELPNELMDDNRPFTISKRYTWSMHEKANLRHDLESWRGRSFEESDFGEGGFNVKKLLGAPCMLNVTHSDKNGKTYANIASVGKLMKGLTVPELQNTQVFFSLEDFNKDLFEALSDGLRELIAKSPEYAEVTSQSHGDPRDQGGQGGDLDDDIPF